MTVDLAIRNWALVLASVLATVVALFVLYRVFTDSARGQLRMRFRMLRRRYREVERARDKVARATRRLEMLEARTAAVKPRHVGEAREALEDARALLKIADDQVLIAENHVRKVILEEYPPRRHDALRSKYLRSEKPDGKSFTF